MKLKIALVFSLCFLSQFPVFSEENQKIEMGETKTISVVPGKKTSLKIQGVTKYILSKPTIASVEITTEEIIITGIHLGTTSLFLRLKDNKGAMLSYVINSNYTNDTTPKKNQSANSFTFKDRRTATTGIYTIQAISTSSGQTDLNYQNINHLLSYDLPVNETSRLTFRSNFLNNLSGFSSLDNLAVPNVELNYLSRNMEAKIGNISARNPFLQKTIPLLDSLFTYTDTLRGAKFSGIMDNFAYSAYGGILKNNLTLYNKTANSNKYVQPNEDSIQAGASGEFLLPFRNLSLFATANSVFEATNNKNKLFNIISAFNMEPFEGLNLNGSLGTNFSSLGYHLQSTYTYSWNKLKTGTDEFKVSGAYRNTGKGYTNINAPAQNNYFLNTNLRLNSGLTATAAYDAGTNNNISNTNLNFSVNQNLMGELLSLNARSTFTTFSKDQQKINTYQAGINSKYLLPFSIDYSFQQMNSIKNALNQHQVRSTIKLLKNDFTDIYLNGNYNQNINANNQSINTGLTTSFAGISLNTTIRPVKEINTGLSIGYLFPLDQEATLIRDKSLNLNSFVNWIIISGLQLNLNFGFNKFLGNNAFQDSLNLGSGMSWNINKLNQLRMDFGYNKILQQNENYNMNTSLTYSYSFGSIYEEAKGTIRGTVYEDNNDNGKRDENEPVIKGIKLALKDKDLEITSNEKGFAFNNLSYGPYEVNIDPEDLPSGYRLTGASPLPVYLNSDSAEADFSVSRFGIIKGIIYRNKAHTSGMPDITLTLDNKETITTGENGLFYFKAASGNHTLRIDPKTIPTGYRLLDKLSKEFNLGKETDQTFTFNPVISIVGKVYNKNRQPAANTELSIKYDIREEIKVETIQTDAEGNFTLNDLLEGSVEISSPEMNDPVEVSIPSNPAQIKLNIILK